MRWGAATATDDAEGAVLATAGGAARRRTAIRAALPAFTGDILQVPPQVSAVKVEGARAYDLARAGETLDLAAAAAARRAAGARRDARPRHRRPRDDLRQGRLRALHRPRPRGGARLPRARGASSAGSGPGPSPSRAPSTWPELEAGGAALAARLLPLEAALAGVPELACPPHAAERLRNGNPVPLPAPALAEGATAWASAGGVPLAIGTWRGGALHPSRVLVLG